METDSLLAAKDKKASPFQELLSSFLALEAVLLVLFAIFTSYGDAHGQDLGMYSSFADVSVMIFIGFGYLMTFLKKYGFGAVGFTYLVSCVTAQWVMLVLGWFRSLHNDVDFTTKIPVTLELMTQGLFGAGAVMISFGALIGKVSPHMMVMVAVCETVFYALNTYIGVYVLGASDCGGSIFIHTFGAYFGLAATYFLTPPSKDQDYRDNESSYRSDLFSLVGTVFLWIYWPSFNSIVADPWSQERAIINTFMALTACCVTAFWASRWFHDGVYDPVDIQNATLAGGVSMGAAANMYVEPWGAMAVGVCAAIVSVVGYRYLLDIIEKKGIHDTCGINNLHGMPGILGGLVSILAAAVTKNPELSTGGNLFRHGSSQALYQLLGLVITLAIAISSGALVGFVVNRLSAVVKPQYTDEVFWAVPTSALVFTKDDARDDLKRVQSTRNRAKGGWSKLKRAVRVTAALRASLAAGRTNAAATSTGGGINDDVDTGSGV